MLWTGTPPSTTANKTSKANNRFGNTTSIIISPIAYALLKTNLVGLRPRPVAGNAGRLHPGRTAEPTRGHGSIAGRQHRHHTPAIQRFAARSRQFAGLSQGL